MKLTEAVPQPFYGPRTQNFSSWLRKFEWGAKCCGLDDAQKVNFLVMHLESPCHEIAADFVTKYENEDTPPGGSVALREYKAKLWIALVAHLRQSSAFVGVLPCVQLQNQFDAIKQAPGELSVQFHARLQELVRQLAESGVVVNKINVWRAFMRGLLDPTMRLDVAIKTGESKSVEDALKTAENHEFARALIPPQNAPQISHGVPQSNAEGTVQAVAIASEEQKSEEQEDTGREILAIAFTVGGIRNIRAAVLEDIHQSLISRRLYEQITEQNSESVVRSRHYVREEVTWIDGRKLHIHGGVELRTDFFEAHSFLVIEDLPCAWHGCDVVLGGEDLSNLGAVDEHNGLRLEGADMTPAVTYPYVFCYVVDECSGDEGGTDGEEEYDTEGEYDDDMHDEVEESGDVPYRYRG